MPDSRDVEAAVLLHGVIKDLEGKPLKQAEVLVSAWPSPESRQAMPEGTDFSIEPAARTATDGQGRFELRSEETPELKMRRGPDGVDIELDVFVGGRHIVYLSQVAQDKGARGWTRKARSAPGDEAPSRGANSRNRLDLTLDRRGGQSTLTDEVPADETGAPRDHVAFPGCSNYTTRPGTSSLETVATGSAGNGVTIKASYQVGSGTSVRLCRDQSIEG